MTTTMNRTTINGKAIDLSQQDPARNLLRFLREDLGLTGAKNGCGVGSCGTCTILVDGKPQRACVKKVKDIADKTVLTIEGFTGNGGALHPLQQSFLDHGAVQCGYCTPGMVLAGHALLRGNPSPSEEEIRLAIKPNLCRCTGYQQIVEAIQAAGEHYKG
jgi:aerobic-type carbon monoxide dehydrogenase small subunit (CoxS/CutS family)